MMYITDPFVNDYTTCKTKPYVAYRYSKQSFKLLYDTTDVIDSSQYGKRHDRGGYNKIVPSFTQYSMFFLRTLQ